ncbi:hypothetical protein FQA39_LY06046 [Lamprigera yunnana]|nr:hypothetical protein FQA39_LY06046 [Lamprigera yunnana]
MKFLSSAFSTFFLIGVCRSDLCQYNFGIQDLPSGAATEVLGFIGGSLSLIFNGCTESIDSNNVKFWLYTRGSSGPTILDSNKPELDNKKTILLIPGWLCNVTNDLMPELKEAYLQRYDSNIIIVDWSLYASYLYSKSYCYAYKVAEVVADFLCRLDQILSINVEGLHLVGHSMGAQISGLIGHDVQLFCNKTVGRITGLDPAGPLYTGSSKSKRLDETDATFVDVIHTNGMGLGYNGRCGDVDFYPNGGVKQPGCSFTIFNILYMYGCSHLRSIDYMIESVNSNKFLACNSHNKAVMGESAIGAPDGSYYLKTNEKYPFATGQYKC